MSRARTSLVLVSAVGALGAGALAPAALAGPASQAAGTGGAGPARAVAASQAALARGAPCRTGQVGGRFALVPGSAGAGNVVYALRVRNVSHAPCSVTGLPRLQLLGAKGKALPTQVRSAHVGMGTALIVVIAPGKSAWASARFSPDVVGPGEPTNGPCEPRATRVRVTVASSAVRATFAAPVVPATPVCVRGQMAVTTLSPVQPTA